MREGLGCFARRSGRRGGTGMKCANRGGRLHVAPEGEKKKEVEQQQQLSGWADLPPELLVNIIQRVEGSQTWWPARKDVIACAAVCQSWRSVTKELARTPEQCGFLTFPISLSQPGPRDLPIQCIIKREKASSTYRLYFGETPGHASKLLLAARKVRRVACTDFLISLAAYDFSRSGSAYLGKLRSNFLGTKFSIYNSSQYLCGLAAQSSTNGWSHKKINSKQLISSKATAGSYNNVATISYEVKGFQSSGPRRMQCIMHSIPISAIHEKGTVPTPIEFSKCLEDQSLTASSRVRMKSPMVNKETPTTLVEPLESLYRTRDGPLVLKNKVPRWREQLQCWCLNFNGRVTVASVKNFQLMAAVDPSKNDPMFAEQEKVILQFGKIGKDTFTMDYCYPLSAFQAFAICLSSFDNKPACE